MAQIVVALNHIIVDPDNPVDLQDLPAEETIRRIKEIYSNFASDVEVTLEGDVAIINLSEKETLRRNQAQDSYNRGVRAAERGKYEAAIDFFQKTLAILPDQVDAHRDLAMAYMEMGNSEAAKHHLVRVMQLQPDDVWAHVILGNLYLQFENDYGSAERYYQVAFDIDPNDLYLLNSYGALKAKREQYAEAREFFVKALNVNPDYPNARYGLALVHYRQENYAAAVAELQELFSRPEFEDPRSQPVYEQARGLFLEANQQLAAGQHEKMMEKLADEIRSYSDESRYPVRLEEDNRIDHTASAQVAWVHGRQEHVIKYKRTQPGILPHLVAHEFEHIRMIDAAVRQDRNRLFTTDRETEEYAQRSVSNDVRRLQRSGMDQEMINQYLHRLIPGLANQLFNAPLDMVIEYRLHQQREYLRPSQTASLHATQQENAQTLETSVRRMVPKRIWQANIAMNCAYALFTDHLFSGATDYAEAYRSSGQFHSGEELFRLWQEQMESYQPGDEYDLVDAFAKVLKLERWYKWKDDRAVPLGPGAGEPDLAPDEGNLLKQKESAATMYCLDALQRFEDMERQQILGIVSEIAMLGRSGLDYASSEQKYTLRSLPGQYSGLHLMCLMYVGFKIVDPAADIGMDLADAYAAAQALHKSGE